MFTKESLEYRGLVEKLKTWDTAYWQDNQPEVPDSVYDQELQRLIKMEKDLGMHAPDSPTLRVGGGLLPGFDKAAHAVPMLSLDNIFSIKDLQTKLEAMVEMIGEKNKPSFTVEPKIDGLSLDLTYFRGGLMQALTRGNGTVGDDVTANVMTIRSVPLKLKGNLPQTDSSVHVRGECFMLKSVFNKLNEANAKKNQPLMANPRNAASGALKLLDSRETAKRQLSFLPYGMVVIDPMSSFAMEQFELLQKLDGLGFYHLPSVTLCHSIDEVLDAVIKFEAIRPRLPFPVDGAVIKLNKLAFRTFFPDGTKAAKHSMAYKYAPTQVETTLNGIIVQVGRTGNITPVGDLEPIEIDGSTVSRASLHNEEIVSGHGLYIGAEIICQKAGEIIPQIVGVVPQTDEQKQDRTPWKFPTLCPSCQTQLERSVLSGGEQGSAWFCPNHDKCPDQIKGRVEHFCSKPAMDLDSVGPGLVDKLFQKGLLRGNIGDLYTIHAGHLQGIPGVGDKTIANFLSQLEASKEAGMERLLVGLGIPSVGEGTAKRLAKFFPDMLALEKANYIKLMEVPDLGPVGAQSVQDWMIANYRIILFLASSGVSMKSKTYNPNAAAGPLTGKIFCFTGALSIERSKAHKMVEDRGGKATGSVSKKTSIVVVGDEAGSKETKAKALGIKCINEGEFMSMMEEV